MMYILLNEQNKGIDSLYLWLGRVWMPIEIGSSPKHLPRVSRFNKSSLRHRMLKDFFLVAEARANFEYFHALTGNAKADIQLRSDVGWWSNSLYV
jgi:hypothetical protein